MQTLTSVVTLPLRSYLTNLLREQLAFYVEEDSLAAALQDRDLLSLGGEVVLPQLHLKPRAVEEALRLPPQFQVERCFIRELRVIPPWTSLFADPIEIRVDNVVVVVKLRSSMKAAKEHAADAIAKEIEKQKGAGARADAGAGTGAESEEEGWLGNTLQGSVIANASFYINNIAIKLETDEFTGSLCRCESLKCSHVLRSEVRLMANSPLTSGARDTVNRREQRGACARQLSLMVYQFLMIRVRCHSYRGLGSRSEPAFA